MNKQQEDWKERVNVILVQLTDEMGYDYTTKRLTAFKKAEQAIYSLIFQARKEAKIEMLTDVEQSFQNGREESEVDDEEENKKLPSDIICEKIENKIKTSIEYKYYFSIETIKENAILDTLDHIAKKNNWKV